MSRGDHADLLDALHSIPVESCDYQEWVDVGMALKQAGFSVGDWKAWSATDTRTDKRGKPYYSAFQCDSKWKGFDNDRMDRVTSGTIIHMAEQKSGWVQPSQRHYGWDDVVATSDVMPTRSYSAELIDSRDVGEESFDKGVPNDPQSEFFQWLRALFRYNEHVCVVTRTEDGRPSGRGRFEMTREQMESLVKERGLDALGISSENEGAFACINPLDGEGREDKNVTDYRYALVESDLIPPGKQLALIHEMRLPCAAITWSGGKSVHAIVHIDANDKAEYRERVSKLYEHLNKNGFHTDEQNKNPSRLTRCPGFERGDGWQRIIEANQSEFVSWDEWQDWLVQEMTKLPEIETFGDIPELPPLAPTIIDGILRRKQKMLVVGPSKAGKSFLMVELAVAIAEGWEWFGHRCQKGRVLIVNFEIQRPSMLRRIQDVWQKMAEHHDTDVLSKGNLDVWNLRGHSAPLDKITPMLVRQAANGAYDLIIIDPIYKVLTGDENSASDMARFCNEFDVIAEQLGCTVVYCHHHAKGDAGRRASMDRASGSGVFTRDPDAFLDMSPISVPQESMELLYYDEGDDFSYQMMAHPFRVSYTLREFATPTPTDVLFKWPVHEVTHDLSDFPVVGEPSSPSERGSKGGTSSASTRRDKADDRWARINALVSEAYDECPRSQPFTVSWCTSWLMDNREEACFDASLTKQALADAVKRLPDGTPKNKRSEWVKASGTPGTESEIVRFK